MFWFGLWFFVFHWPLLASIVNIIVMKLRFEAGSISVQFEHYLGLILLSIIITHHDASSVFFFDAQKSPNLMMFYFWWKNCRFPWRGSKLQTTGEQTLIKAWSSKDWTRDPFLNFFGFFFQFVVSLSGSIMPWMRAKWTLRLGHDRDHMVSWITSILFWKWFLALLFFFHTFVV